MSVGLAEGRLDIVLRRSPRARRLRVVVDARRGVVVTVPGRPDGAERRGRPTPVVERFLREREAWIRRHLDRVSAGAARAPRGGELSEGSVCLYRGERHLIRLENAPPTARRSSVAREGAEHDELVVRLARRDGRPADRVLREWLTDRARAAIDRAVARHAPALAVAPAGLTVRDQRTRWGSASRQGRLSFSWRLILAPPEALETVVVHELAHLRVFGHGPDFWALVASRVPDHAGWRRWLRRHAAELHGTLDDAVVRDGADPI